MEESIAKSASEECKCVCSEHDIFVYPDETYLDRGKIVIQSVANRKILIEIPIKSDIIEFINPTVDKRNTIVETNNEGKAEASIKYNIPMGLSESYADYSDIDVLLDNINDLEVIGYYQTISDAGPKKFSGKSWQLFQSYEYSIKANMQNLINEYNDPNACPGALPNPCFEIPLFTDGLLNNALALTELTGKSAGLNVVQAYENFACASYQERLLSWFYKKRFHNDKKIAARVNGIEMLPYSIIGGVHRFVGIFPAGLKSRFQTSADSCCTKTLDPWWFQDGPRVITPANQKTFSVLLAATVVAPLTIEAAGSIALSEGIALKNAFLRVLFTAGATGGIGGATWVSSTSLTWEEAIKKIGDAASLDIVFDSESSHLIDLSAENPVYDKETVNLILNKPEKVNFPDDMCASSRILAAIEGNDLFNLLKGVADHLVKLSVSCPVKITIKGTDGKSDFSYNLVDNSYSGEIPGIIFSMTDEENGETKAQVLFSGTESDIRIEALESGTFTLSVTEIKSGDKKPTEARYQDIPIQKGDQFALQVINDKDHQALLGPNNELISPTVMAVEVDIDRDGHTELVDCDDKDAAIYPGADEICDEKDNNCDGAIDEGCNLEQSSGGGGGSCFVGGIMTY